MKTDIFSSTACAIVCPANSTLLGGTGLDGAIRKRLSARISLPRQLATGHAVLSDAPGLTFDFIIHAAPPIWKGGEHRELSQLRQCYRSIIKICLDNQIRSVAIPAIGTGAYGCPVDSVGEIAAQETEVSSIDFDLYPSLGDPVVPDDFIVYQCCNNQWDVALHPMFPERLDWFPVCDCGKQHSPAYQLPKFVP